MKKVILAIIMALLLALGFAGCKDKEKEEETTTETTQAADPQDIINALESIYSGDSDPSGSTNVETPYEEPTVPETMPEGQKVNTGTATDKGIPKDTKFYSYFKTLTNSKKFTLSADCRSNASGLNTKIPITMAVSGEKMYTSTTVPVSAGVSMRADFIVDGGKSYIVMPDFKMYMQISSEEMDSSVGSLSGITVDDGDMNYVKTTKMTVDGKQYLCEEYKSGDGVMKCYFTDNGKNLDKIELISDGNITVMDNVKISSKVDSSLFTVPSGYMDMSKMSDMNSEELSGLFQ